MADDSSWSAVVDRIQGMVLNFTDESVGDVKIADTSNPFDIGKFAKIVVGVFASLYFVGVSAFQQAIATFVSNPFTALGNYYADIIDAMVGGAGDSLEVAAETTRLSVETLEVFAFVAAVAAVLAALYIASLGVSRFA